MRIRSTTRLGLLLLAWVGAACEAPDGEPTARPNVLLYVVDTLRPDLIEPYGSHGAQTPAIRSLAQDGLLFENVYASSTWTRPSIASLLTGLAPDVHGVVTRRDTAASSLETLAERFQQAGYRTGAIVTNPNVGRHFGFDQGYHDFIELFDHEGGGAVEATAPKAGADEVTRRVVEWIEATERPFFLFVLTTDPHAPYSPPKAFDRYLVAAPDQGQLSDRHHQFFVEMAAAQGRYYGEIAANDAAFGELLEYLRSRGIYDGTCIAFASDHGEHFGEHAQRLHGTGLYEEALRVPLILKRPHETEPGRRIQAPAQLLDLFPTLLRSANLEAPPGLEAIALPASGTSGRTFYAHLELDGFSGEALVDFPWKLLSPDTPRAGKRRFGGGLFRLDEDPREIEDLSATELERGASMREQLRRRAQANAPKAAAYRENARESPTRELPEADRKALEVLGYLDPQDPHPPE